MSQKDVPNSPEVQLDRLIDGELNEADRRELLLQLEREPAGWRRCALAFLEAQCWKQELVLAKRPLERTEPEPKKALAAARTGVGLQRLAAWRTHLATALTMGACFLIALALGIGLRGNLAGIHGPATSTLTETKQAFPLNGSAVQEPADKWELVTLSADSPNGQTGTVSIPAVRRDSLDSRMLEQVPDVIPPGVRRELVQAGHQIEEHREVVPVPMNDGRRLMVPVNNVQIHFVGRGSL